MQTHPALLMLHEGSHACNLCCKEIKLYVVSAPSTSNFLGAIGALHEALQLQKSSGEEAYMTPKKFTGNASTLTSKPFPPLLHFIRLPRDKAASLVLSLWMMPGWGMVSLEDSQAFLLSRRTLGSSGAQIHALLHVGSCCRTLLHGAEWLSAAVLAAQYCPHLAKLLTLWGQSHQSLRSGSFLINSLLWSSFECVNHEV